MRLAGKPVPTTTCAVLEPGGLADCGSATVTTTLVALQLVGAASGAAPFIRTEPQALLAQKPTPSIKRRREPGGTPRRSGATFEMTGGADVCADASCAAAAVSARRSGRMPEQ